jgi:hypothetical protein
MQIVSDHLSDDGVFLQWINSQFVDEALLKSLCATILDVYPHVRIYQWSSQVLFFLASHEPMDVEREMFASGRPLRDAPLFYLELGIAAVEDAVAALMMDTDGAKEFSSGSRLITDNFNMMAMQSARLMREGRVLSVEKLETTFQPWIPALNAESWVHKELGEDLVFSRIADKYVSLGVRGYLPELVGTLTTAGNPRALLLAGNLMRSEGNTERAQEILEAAFVAMPDNNQVKYALVEPWLRRLDQEQTPEVILTIAESMTGSGRAVIEASKAIGIKNLQAVADLDRQLGAAGPADLWFTEAVKLRVDWRSGVSNEELKQDFADQAWQILDLGIANQRDHEFLTMRIGAASQAGRANEVMQSTRGYIDTVDFLLSAVEEGYIFPTAAEFDLKLNQLEAITKLVHVSADNEAVTQSTKRDIQMGLDGLAERLQDLKLVAK